LQEEQFDSKPGKNPGKNKPNKTKNKGSTLPRPSTFKIKILKKKELKESESFINRE
jgi:hypothetical protein